MESAYFCSNGSTTVLRLFLPRELGKTIPFHESSLAWKWDTSESTSMKQKTNREEKEFSKSTLPILRLRFLWSRPMRNWRLRGSVLGCWRINRKFVYPEICTMDKSLQVLKMRKCDSLCRGVGQGGIFYSNPSIYHHKEFTIWDLLWILFYT